MRVVDGVLRGARAGANHLEHPGRRVVVKGALAHPRQRLEVVLQVGGVPAEVAEEDDLAATLQEEQIVKHRKDGRRGLVDRADERPAGCGDALHPAHDERRRARVEPARRLIEKEDRGIRRQLDADRQTLHLLKREPGAVDRPNHLLANRVQLQKLHLVLDKGAPLLCRDCRRKTQLRREHEALKDGGARRVHAKLLHVAHLLDECVLGLALAVDVEVALDLSLRLAVCEHVE
mmetsp:Transcript_8919/g.19334  ORF Transcript_8919/g.19334 Transcript_8919/m.19334 type:complete len:233 (+) Transcript_8919:1197-1895(+)